MPDPCEEALPAKPAAIVLGRDPMGDAVEPQPVLRWRWNLVDPPPGCREHLGYQIRSIGGGHPPQEVGVDGSEVLVVEMLEPNVGIGGVFVGGH